MDEEYKTLTRNISDQVSRLRRDIPTVMRGFSNMAAAAMDDGTLEKKTKELIALALGVAGHCKPCIGFHVEALIKLGAARAEIEEALGVAVYMGGGPSLMYAAEAMRAYEEFCRTHGERQP